VFFFFCLFLNFFTIAGVHPSVGGSIKVGTVFEFVFAMIKNFVEAGEENWYSALNICRWVDCSCCCTRNCIRAHLTKDCPCGWKSTYTTNT
jgi:hypothetical protein